MNRRRACVFDVAQFADSYRGEATEDRSEIVHVDTDDASEAYVLIIADGVGGRPGGGAAADRAVHLTREAVVAGAGRERFRGSLRSADNWRELLTFVDEMVSEEEGAGETTLLAAYVTPTHIWGASVGDSETWWIGSDAIVDLTERQRRKPFLGGGMCIPTPFAFRVPPNKTGALLLATDGLFKYADTNRICEIMCAAEAAGNAASETARTVAELARLSSGAFHDDIAVIVCRYDASSAGNKAASRKPGFWERL